MSAERPYFLTTPIYYVNDLPHLGHAYTTVACDVLARFMRLDGRDVRFLTGTDEHGQKVERSAQARGQTPQEFADEISGAFRDMGRLLNISNDDYIRTTEPRHQAAVAKILQAVHDNGREDIYLGHYEGLYCVSCEAYYVEADLLPGGLCPIHERPVETVQEDNYFFRLSPMRTGSWSTTRRILVRSSRRPDATRCCR